MSKNKPTPEADEEFVRDYISKVRWKFAKSYGKTAPHEYTVKEWEEELEEDFDRFVTIIRTYGYAEKYWSKTHWYFEVDGLKYWTMGFPLGITIIINRADVDTVYGNQAGIEEFPRSAPF
jgi:hypothetical protein